MIKMLLYEIQARTKKSLDSSVGMTHGRTVQNIETEIQAFREPPASDWLVYSYTEPVSVPFVKNQLYVR